MGTPALLTTEELAHEMGYADRSSVHRRIETGDLRLAACRLPGNSHRCWSRARLLAAGFLTPAVPAPPSTPAVPPATQTVAVWRLA